MSRARPHFVPEPTLGDWVKLDGLADWFGASVPTMRRKLPGLYAEGFPRPCAVIGKWYLPACRDWAAGASGTLPRVADDPLMRAYDGHRPH